MSHRYRISLPVETHFFPFPLRQKKSASTNKATFLASAMGVSVPKALIDNGVGVLKAFKSAAEKIAFSLSPKPLS